MSVIHSFLYVSNKCFVFVTFFNAMESIIQSIKFEYSSNQTTNHQDYLNQAMPVMTVPTSKIENLRLVMTEIRTTSKNNEVSDQFQTEKG